MRIGLFTDAYLPDINGVVSSVATLKRGFRGTRTYSLCDF